MTKKIKSTVDTLLESMSTKERQEFNNELKDFALSELILALMEQDEVSVRKLAKMAGVSPTIVQAMRSGTRTDFTMQSFFKILNSLGCKKLMVEVHGNLIPLNIVPNKR